MASLIRFQDMHLGNDVKGWADIKKCHDPKSPCWGDGMETPEERKRDITTEPQMPSLWGTEFLAWAPDGESISLHMTPVPGLRATQLWPRRAEERCTLPMRKARVIAVFKFAVVCDTGLDGRRRALLGFSLFCMEGSGRTQDWASRKGRGSLPRRCMGKTHITRAYFFLLWWG